MRGAPVSRAEGKRKRKRNDEKSARRIDDIDWSDDMEDEKNAKIRESWAFQRLETFQMEEFPDGFPPEIDVNAVYHELDRSQFSSPDAHIITVLWREHEDKIRAFGEAISRSESWRDVVEGPDPHMIPAIGGKDEIMALVVLCYGFEMGRWLRELWEPLQLDWVAYPDNPQPRFWAGVELSRGSVYQESWARGHERQLDCDIASLLVEEKKPRNHRKARRRRSKKGPVDSDSDDEPVARGRRSKRKPVDSDSDDEPLVRRSKSKRGSIDSNDEPVARGRRSKKSKRGPIDSDDEPLVRRDASQRKPKPKKIAVVVRLLEDIDSKLDQERADNTASKAEMERKLKQLEEDVKKGQEVCEEYEVQIEGLKASHHSMLGRMETMGDSLVNLQQTLNKFLPYTADGTRQDGVGTSVPIDSTVPWKVPRIPIPEQRAARGGRVSCESDLTLE